jgi:hypothetical protein
LIGVLSANSIQFLKISKIYINICLNQKMCVLICILIVCLLAWCEAQFADADALAAVVAGLGCANSTTCPLRNTNLVLVESCDNLAPDNIVCDRGFIVGLSLANKGFVSSISAVFACDNVCFYEKTA